MGVFDDILGETGSFFDPADFSGSGAARVGAEAATEGARLQTEAGREALELLRGDLAPFRDLFGPEESAGLLGLATDPGTQAAFLQDNPLFEALKGDALESTFRTQSAGGALGGSGTDQILQNQFLTLGNDLINQQINRSLPLLNVAQSSAAQSGIGSTDLLTGIGNAQAAGGVGAANAQIGASQQKQQLLGTVAGLFASDERLKENIKPIGKYNGNTVYSWDWNDKADKIGLSGSSCGHIAQEVQKTNPELIHSMDNGYYAINYGTDKTVRLH